MSCTTCYNTCYEYAGCSCNSTCYGYTETEFKVEIDCSAEVPQEFKWSSDGGLTWEATNVPITGSWQDLALGAKIKFDSIIGHVLTDSWVFWGGEGVFVGERIKKYFEDYGGLDLIEHEFHSGSNSQLPSATIQAEYPGWKEAMRNTCYSWFRLTYNANAFKSIPEFSVVLRGKKVYDPRNDSTTWSRNPALAWLDFMTSTRYGLGVPISLIDMDSVEDAANWCDAYGYYFDGVILDRQAFLDNMEDMLNNFRGYVVWSEGVYKLKIHDDDAAVMTLDEDDVEISESSFSISIPGIPESINKVKTVFADAEINYTTNFASWEDSTQLTYDGESKVFEIPLIGTSSFVQAQKLAKFYCMRNKYSKEFSILAHPRTYLLEPGDMILVTHEFPNWNLKKLRVKSVSLAEDGLVALVLMDEDNEIYDETITPSANFDANWGWIGISSTSPTLVNLLVAESVSQAIISTSPIIESNTLLSGSATHSIISTSPILTPYYIESNDAIHTISSTGPTSLGTGLFRPASSTDDCTTAPTMSVINLNYNYVFMGSGGWMEDINNAGFRFVNVTIPQGATITRAKVTFQAYRSDASVNCDIVIAGEDSDDASTFSTYANYTGRIRTAASVAWDNVEEWVINTDYDTPEIKTIIQEIVDRVGWSSGNDLVLFFTNTIDGNNPRAAKSYDLSSSLCARLYVEWSAS